MNTIEIPPSWQECPQEYLEKAIAAAAATYSNRWIDNYGRQNFSGHWEILDYQVLLNRKTIDETVDAMRVQETVRVFARRGMQIISREISYYPWWYPKPGQEHQDICMYCGTNNSAHDGSSLREGWDCYNCGGN